MAIIKKKCKSIKMSDYFEIMRTKDQLAYFKLVPHQSTRNYQNVEFTKIINRCYKKATKRFSKTNNVIKFEQETKVSLFIYMSKKARAEFYLIVPKLYAGLFAEKISTVWEKVEMQEVDDIPRFDKKAFKCSMEYTRNDSLSLDLGDKKSSEFLESQLNVLDMIGEEDEVGIFYNFNYRSPYKQLGFKTKHTQCLDRILDGKSIDKNKGDIGSILRGTFNLIAVIGDSFLEEVSVFLGGSRDTKKTNQKSKNNDTKIKKVNDTTKNKAQSEVVDTQILLLSQSPDNFSAKNTLASMAQAYTRIDGDNTLRPKNISRKIDINFDKSSLPSAIAKNIMSVDELAILFTQPGKELIKKFKLMANTINQEYVPEFLREGYISIGKVIQSKGADFPAYLNSDPDIDTGLACIGKQGSGKTEFLKNYANYCIKNGDSIILIDYIGNNDLANTVQKVVPKNKLVLIDLKNPKLMQALAYNELFYTDDMDTMDKLDVISSKTQYSAELINAITTGQELTSAMRRYFTSASNITFANNQFASFKDIVDCLERYDVRMSLIENIPDEFKDEFQDDIYTLLKLNDKYTKGELKGEDNGETCEGKIDRILDRISLMRESIRTKHMFNKSPENNVNFEECFKEGKVIIVKMDQSVFGAKHIRSMLTTFFVTKSWISCINRKSNTKEGEELRRVHMMIDEPHQVPKVLEMLVDEMPQMRKFRLKPVYAIHSLKQVETVYDSLKSSGFSFMLLAGSDKINYNYLKEDLYPYEVEDLISLERFTSLNLVPDDKGIKRPFITKLPPALKV